MRSESLMFYLLMAPVAVLAGEADVTDVKANDSGARTYTFHVSVKHGDTGWDHYADKWDIVVHDGMVLGTRTL
jgi:hypothetical protein